MDDMLMLGIRCIANFQTNFFKNLLDLDDLGDKTIFYISLFLPDPNT